MKQVAAPRRSADCPARAPGAVLFIFSDRFDGGRCSEIFAGGRKMSKNEE
jgi:hypothetical protein